MIQPEEYLVDSLAIGDSAPATPSTYSVVEYDERDIPFVISQGRSLEDADAIVARGRAAGRSQVSVRENGEDIEAIRHPARGFLDMAACHRCGHFASHHYHDGQPCFICLANSVGSVKQEIRDGGVVSYFRPKCRREREAVLLDGLVDLQAAGITLERVLLHRHKILTDVIVERDPTGLGYRLALVPPRKLK
jgi:hypothetical protein